MLPDFPKEKELFSKFWNRYLELKHQEFLGFFSTIPSFTIHEGDRWKIKRADGTESEKPYQDLSSSFTIGLSDVPDLTPEKIREKLDMVAEHAAQQMSRNILGEITRATEQAGNTVGGKGKPLTKELYFEMLEKIEAAFTPEGEWIPPSFLMSPDAWNTNKEKFKEWHQDLGFINRQTEIITKQREAWNAREALRKLVD